MSINVINDIYGLEDKNHLVVSIDTENVIDKTQHVFMINILESSTRMNIPQQAMCTKSS